MSLFTKSIDEITFEDVEQFIVNWKEGVRVEYKEDFPTSLPKSVSSFANTLGGVMVLGVKEDNQVQAHSIIGLAKVTGIKEKVIDSSVNGIYPSVLPDVKVIDLPADPSKVVVVIKISESDLAPHAIQNSTKIPIRQENITQIIVDADIDRIEFLLKRREDSKKFREELFGKMLDHCQKDLKQAEDKKMPLIQIGISPLYPYKPIIAKDRLYKFANEYSSHRGLFFRIRSDAQRISDGVFNRLLEENSYVYNRLNDYGCLLSIQAISEYSRKDRDDTKTYLTLYSILNPLWHYLELVSQLYKTCDPPYRGNLLIEVNLINVLNREIILSEWTSIHQYPSHEKQISLFRQLITDELKDIHLIVQSIGKEIFWAFQIDSPEMDKIIDKSLRDNGFLPPLKS